MICLCGTVKGCSHVMLKGAPSDVVQLKGAPSDLLCGTVKGCSQ